MSTKFMKKLLSKVSTSIVLIFSLGVLHAHATTNPSVWWPTNGAHVSGTQPVKALLDGQDTNTYQMFWSVDNGSWTRMPVNTTDWPHMENQIDYSNWNWKGRGPYTLNFIATDNWGHEISRTNVDIYVDQSVSQAPVTEPVQTISQPVTPPAPLPVPVAAPVPAPAPKPTPVPISPVVTMPAVPSPSKLYVDPNNPALAQAVSWQNSQPHDAALMQKMGNQPVGIWLGGWNADVRSDVQKNMQAASAQNATPTFVAYNVPGRDCGSYSAGGASNTAEYLKWIGDVSAGIGSGKAILVLEPDGLANIDCMGAQGQAQRFRELSGALDIFKANNPNTQVYVDAGHANWIDSNTMANRLNKVGVSKARGFALNVSNFVDTNSNIAYGQKVSQLTNGSHFVIDTSRNGNGSDGNWCNPSGRALGQNPTMSTGNPLVDAFLWIKRPGESDGNCNGGPNAGVWWPEYALTLAKNAGY